ncbi:MAG: RNA polymerase sigma factor [Pyrinomonadaceae bacterium]|nr:RNA polymerase sigma factor [Pyrinomonadaceae bacterium]MCX7639809.1 RNA polymerase sigma factor [Pyrinomonadaceae bacterium]MDW8304392.1 RNA polymerase sigma factor [Acidobacteriota bacterium]
MRSEPASINPFEAELLEEAELNEEEKNESLDDFSLLRKASEGNSAAFEAIYRRHHRRVYNLCLRMLKDSAEAEDLTQEVFIQLYRKMDSFRGESAFSTWLYRLTVNQVLMHLRRKQIKNEKTTEDGQTPRITHSESEKKVQVIEKIALERAISELPNGYRTIFMLHDVEGLQHEEIAKMLGLSVGTSKSQLHKARMKLRNLLFK